MLFLPPTGSLGQCELADKIANSPFYTIAVIRVICGVIGTAACLYTFRREGLKWLVHPNAKVIFLNHSILTILTAFFHTINYGFEIYRMTFPSDDSSCKYRIYGAMAFWIRIPVGTLLMLQSVNVFTFTIERAVATAFPASYERVASPIGGVVASIAGTTFSIVITFFCIIYPNKYDSFAVSASVMTPDNKDSYTYWIAVMATMDSVTMVVLIVSALVTKKQRMDLRKDKNKELGSKYQITQNGNIFMLLLPCFIAHNVLQIMTSVGVSIYSLRHHNYSSVESTIVVEMCNQTLLYTLIMPAMLFCRNRVGKRPLKLNKVYDASEHQRHIEQYWI